MPHAAAPLQRSTPHRAHGPGRALRLARCGAALGLVALLTACGSGPPQARLLEGEAEYLVRRNPPACLLDQPTLHYEVRVGTAWARVWVEGPLPGGEESALALANGFAADPLAIRVVRGDLLRRTRSYAGGHPAQVLRVETLPDLEDAGAVDAPPGFDEADPAAEVGEGENAPPEGAEGTGEGTQPPP
jgi:hypothetical protein